ncbi:MAG TPA: CpaF family protein [Acetivibrio sp.]|uniref:CpaF family protein n=1 Tax=Acetivibrio sp. TaxID=1872092 RepID=UPI002B86022F|nr:CpaF family protein [Acetivibrio sp.]HOM03332.1 CpaF family protein [Acetivibrio sp.]
MEMEEKEKFVARIRKHISDNLDLRKDFSDEEIKDVITNVVFETSRDYYLSVGEKKEIADAIFNSMRRLDVLQPLIDDKSITEIMINGPDSIFIERNGRVSKLDVKFENRRKLEDVIQTIVSRVNRAVNEASPIVDARLSDGSRVNVVLPPIALNGPVVTIRKFSEKPMTIEQLIKFGSITEEVAGVLERMVKAKYNIFICGGTGSGKTTFLNALSNFIPKDERIITIEDSAELQIIGIENIVRLETRNANTEGKGEISIRDLIKTSLRMRPERIIVGEVRGKEALDMLQAMNTGHDGSLSTGHANSTRDMLSRLETMVLSGAEMPLEAIRQQIASALDIIIHLGRLRDKSRRTLEITEVVEYKDGEIVLNPLYEFVEEGETPERQIIGSLRRTKNKLVNNFKFKMAGISDDF